MKVFHLIAVNCSILASMSVTGCNLKDKLIEPPKPIVSTTPTPLARIFPKVDCTISKCVALTFDDGPDKYTLKYLKLLDVPATFFVVGKNVQAYPKIVQEVSNAGHQICNHSWNHPNMAKIGPKAVDEQIQKTDAIITKVIGEKYKQCFRFPYASIPRGFFKSHPDLLHVAWTSDSEDWRFKDPKIQYTKVMKQVPKNGVILFHDVHPGALTTVPKVIMDLKSKGYTFVTIDDLNLPKGQLNMENVLAPKPLTNKPTKVIKK